MTGSKQHGECICGAVKFTTEGNPERITVCHCRWCQQRTGTAFGTEVVFLKENVAFEDKDIGSYRHISDESGRWVDVHFCTKCGTNLGLTLEIKPEIRSVPAGTFSNPNWFDEVSPTLRHVYTRSKRHWGEISKGVESFEGYFK